MFSKIIAASWVLVGLASCLQSPKTEYAAQHDAFADVGQYNFPEQKFGQQYWVLASTRAQGEDALVENLVCESVVGLLALGVNDSKSQVMAWMEVEGNTRDTYKRIQEALPMKNLGTLPVWDLLGRAEIRALIDGYVLYDINNHESVNAATVAAHVFNGVMIDKRDAKRAEALGYKMLFDASKMDLGQSWSMFRDKCNNNALVLMPAYTSNQRSTAIAYRLMTVNLNKVSYKPELGNNKELLIEVMKWLEPLSPVMGWEQAVGEDSFVGLVSATGNLMIPYDWTVNTPLLAADYKNRQTGLVKVTDPTRINYGDAKNYMAYYMSDGDNVMWAISGYDTPNYYASEKASKTRMTFGYPVANLSMICPDQNAYLLAKQNPDCSLMESLGGGYYYADEFAELKDRPAILDKAARTVAAHMRQHRNNVLALVCMDVVSDRAKEAYEAYIRNNDELIGIVVIQYTPYAGGKGEVMWFKNAQGYDIPVVTVRYSLWNYGEGRNGELEGTPAYIASKYNELAAGTQEPTFSVTSVHAWSRFARSDDPRDLTAENAPGGAIYGVESAEMCQDKLCPEVKVVNVEELIWQLRMHTHPDQTKEILKRYK